MEGDNEMSEGERRGRRTNKPLPKSDAFFNSKKKKVTKQGPDCAQSEVRGFLSPHAHTHKKSDPNH
jgi:hypothetical protein